MKKYKLISLILTFTLAMTLSSCGKKSTETTEEIGKVTAIDGNTVTIQTFTSSGDTNSDATLPEMPSDNNTENNSNGEQSTPPAKTDGDSTENESTPPAKPDGDNTENDKNGGQTNQSQMPSADNTDKSNGDGQGTPPEKPEGDNTDNSVNGGQASMPQMPSGESPQMGETKTITIDDISILYKYDGETEVQASLSDIIVGAILKITYSGENMTKIIIGTESDFNIGGNTSMVNGGNIQTGNNNGNGAGNTSDVVYGGATEISSATTQSDTNYSSETADQSALLISTSDTVSIDNPTVTKSGDSNGGDNCNFYGQNAAVLVKGGSTTTITGGTVSTSATGANGIFSYGGNGGQNGAEGDGTTVIVSDTTITTTGSGSGGIMTTGGGITKASNLTVTTSGQSSAAIRTDRGGGTVTVDGGTYTTNGLGSPAVYSTADITVSNATLTSNLSEGVCIEGLNSITLNNVNLTANNTSCNGNATFHDTIMIYQSMSGDAASGTSSFTMNGGTLTSQNGHVFHITNTNGVITLDGVTIVNNDDDNILLSVCDDGWNGGSNIATVNTTKQTLTGGILVGDNSQLTLNLSDNSCFNGYINGNITNADGKSVSTQVGTVSVTLDDSSTLNLTGDTYVTSFSGNATNVVSNGYTLYVNGTALTGTK